MPAAMYNELFSKISDGNLTPRLFKKTESPIERLDLTFGNEIKIIHQNIYRGHFPILVWGSFSYGGHFPVYL